MMNKISILQREVVTVWVVFIFLGLVAFTLIQMQFKGAEKRIISIESIDHSHTHALIPHTHRYSDGKAILE